MTGPISTIQLEPGMIEVPVGSVKYQAWYPQNEIETDQGHEEWQSLPADMVAHLRSPLDPGIGLPTPLYNGVVGGFFPVTLQTTQSIVALIENIRRAYLVIQNLGPGNVFVQFGSAAVAGLTLKLVPSQVYEPQIAGYQGTNCPIRNSVNLIADLANTVAVVGEAVWMAKGLL